MRFIVDAQLPPDLVVFLREKGFEANHVNRLRLGSATDQAVWEHARMTRAVLVTKDIDFLRFSERAVSNVQTLWVRVGNTTNAALRLVFERSLPEILTGLAAGETLIEIR